ncbi:MAG: FixH family protein [Sphaerobacter sp.]|nr:FixH family protein [Sphaerobacter sp.]
MSTGMRSQESAGIATRLGSWQRRALIGLGLVVAVVAIGYALMWVRMHQPPPDDLDLSTTRLTAAGHYRATILPGSDPIPINRLHTWTLHVETPDGRPVESAQITVDGDMPQHGHGLPTRPQVTRYLGNGDYLVEGMKFQMGGWWVVDFTITADGRRDTVRFNLVLE